MSVTSLCSAVIASPWPSSPLAKKAICEMPFFSFEFLFAGSKNKNKPTVLQRKWNKEGGAAENEGMGQTRVPSLGSCWLVVYFSLLATRTLLTPTFADPSQCRQCQFSRSHTVPSLPVWDQPSGLAPRPARYLPRPSRPVRGS